MQPRIVIARLQELSHGPESYEVPISERQQYLQPVLEVEAENCLKCLSGAYQGRCVLKKQLPVRRYGYVPCSGIALPR